MIRGEFGAHIEQAVFFHAEFAEDRLGLDLGLAEMAALRLGDVLGLGAAGADLDGGVAVPILFADGNDLHAFERQNGDRHMAAVVLEQAGHPHFLRDHASARSEEHTSELQSLMRISYAVFCLKKKTKI